MEKILEQLERLDHIQQENTKVILALMELINNNLKVLANSKK